MQARSPNTEESVRAFLPSFSEIKSCLGKRLHLTSAELVFSPLLIGTDRVLFDSQCPNWPTRPNWHQINNNLQTCQNIYYYSTSIKQDRLVHDTKNVTDFFYKQISSKYTRTGYHRLINKIWMILRIIRSFDTSLKKTCRIYVNTSEGKWYLS